MFQSLKATGLLSYSEIWRLLCFVCVLDSNVYFWWIFPLQAEDYPVSRVSYNDIIFLTSFNLSLISASFINWASKISFSFWLILSFSDSFPSASFFFFNDCENWHFLQVIQVCFITHVCLAFTLSKPKDNALFDHFVVALFHVSAPVSKSYNTTGSGTVNNWTEAGQGHVSGTVDKGCGQGWGGCGGLFFNVKRRTSSR